jgi:ribulose 1,5-bisphosphate carboxylase large subunit-like protein
VKARITKQQRAPAVVMDELKNQLDTLKEMEKLKDEEKSKRWRANFDYVMARLQAHYAYVHEYSFMLGQIRSDALPKRDPAKHSGWRLASTDKLQSGGEAKKLAADAKKRLEKLAKEHAGTPWEVMAKRQALTSLGLQWQPTP